VTALKLGSTSLHTRPFTLLLNLALWYSTGRP